MCRDVTVALADLTLDRSVETAKRLEGLWAGIHRLEEEMAARWTPTLTPELVAELERKSQSDEDMTKDELEQWSVAVELSNPEQTAPEEEWDRWYETPVSAFVAKKTAKQVSTAPEARPRGSLPRGAQGQRRRRSRSRSPGRLADDADLADAAALEAFILERGPHSASELARALGRRKEYVLRDLNSDNRFRCEGKGRSARWIATARPFDVAEAAATWDCSPKMALELITGEDGFLAQGWVRSLNGGSEPFAVTEAGRTASLTFGSLRGRA